MKGRIFLYFIGLFLVTTFLFSAYYKNGVSFQEKEKLEESWKDLVALYRELPERDRMQFKSSMENIATAYYKGIYMSDLELKDKYRELGAKIKDLKGKMEAKKLSYKTENMKKFLHILSEEAAKISYNDNFLLGMRIENLRAKVISSVDRKKLQLARLAYKNGNFTLADEVLEQLETKYKNVTAEKRVFSKSLEEKTTYFQQN